MPIPNPRPNEKQNDFISRCVSALADSDPNMPNEQRVAICFDKWRKSKGIKKMQECPEGQEWDAQTEKCIPCPGGKIRSKGKGRGEGRGKGKGPIGIPYGEELEEEEYMDKI